MQTNTIENKTPLWWDFKVGDKVRVLRNDAPDEKAPKWKTSWFGVINKMGDKFALVWDYKVSDSNTGLLTDSSEWCPFESKMLKIIKD